MFIQGSFFFLSSFPPKVHQGDIQRSAPQVVHPAFCFHPSFGLSGFLFPFVLPSFLQPLIGRCIQPGLRSNPPQVHPGVYRGSFRLSFTFRRCVPRGPIPRATRLFVFLLPSSEDPSGGPSGCLPKCSSGGPSGFLHPVCFPSYCPSYGGSFGGSSNQGCGLTSIYSSIRRPIWGSLLGSIRDCIWKLAQTVGVFEQNLYAFSVL